MDFSGQTAMSVRRIARRLGILPPIVRAFRLLSGSQYEERFDHALLSVIRSGDLVWDIGANVGLYTDKFLSKVGSGGQVVAFEPSPRNVDALRVRFASADGVVVCPVALAERSGTATFFANGSPDGTTDSLVERSGNAIRHVVPVHRGDEFLERYPPNVIKIDVEGYEWEVLQGLGIALLSDGLRAVMIEVHFGILDDRGLRGVPAKLTDLLRQSGLSTFWMDASHLAGVRPG